MKDHPQTQPDPVEPEKGPESASQIASARTIADDPGSDSEITCRGEDIARFRDALEIGRGGMGAIYDVYDPDLDRRTALKMQLRPASGEDDSLGRFVREARITGWLEHPNIVPVHELGRTEEGGFFFSMKKVGGQSLAQHLFESASLEGVDWKREQRKLLRDFLKICDAVSFAHSRGVVHRDLKPENVMLGDFGEVLVMDWGLAKIVGKEDPFSDSLTENADIEFEEMGAGGVRTQEGIVVGTPMYMAPEQAWGCHDEIDGRTDIYSLGAMLYEIVTRSRPYLENSAQEILVRLRRGIVDHPRKRSPELSGELAAIVSRAMAFEAEDRYATVDGLRDDILHYLEGGWVEAARYSVIERLTKWIRRHRVGVGIGAAVVLSAATVLVGTRMVRGAHRKALLEGLVSQAVRGAAELSARVEAHQVTLGKRSADGELGLENREKSESLLAELQERVELWSKAYRLDPQNQRLRLEVHRNYLDLGRFAQQSEAFTLARFAFREAGALSEDPQEWERNLAGLQRARGARLGRHRKRILSVLDTVRTGKGAWTRKGDQPLVLELASFRERQTVDLLLGEMEALTTRLRKVTEESFLNINELSEKEIEIGWKPIVGLEEVVRKWMRAERPLADEKALALF
ncbi:MAG: serine/threonine-protein kinase, partial [Planctomycetota bacterium]|nr:serine/threonine-protein kinase [Planctomycetota bacterium]